MKKVILALLCVIVLSGCSAEYNITFDKNMHVEEELFGYESDEFFSSYTNSSYNRVVSFIIEPNLDYFNNNNYNIDIGSFDGNKGAKINRSFNDFNEYKEISKIYLEAVDDISYTEDNGIVTIKAKIHINTNEQNQEKYYVSNLKLNIKLPFEVKKSNADSVSDGIYTWNFDKENNNREIEISFDKNKVNVDYTLYIIIGGIALAVIIVFMFFYFKFKNHDKLNEI